MRTPRLPLVLSLAAAVVFGQSAATPASGSSGAKSTKSAKATRPGPSVTFQAHNEGGAEGAIYGDDNLVTVTIDSSGIRYQSKGMDKPVSISWAEVSGWQPNNFTSKRPSRTTTGDYGIGIHQGAKYISFRTRNGRDYSAALKALRTLAYAKEQAGIG